MKKSIAASLGAVALTAALVFSGIPLAFGTDTVKPILHADDVVAAAKDVAEAEGADAPSDGEALPSQGDFPTEEAAPSLDETTDPAEGSQTTDGEDAVEDGSETAEPADPADDAVDDAASLRRKLASLPREIVALAEDDARDGAAAPAADARAAEVASGNFGTGNALHWSLTDDGTLTITGSGPMGNLLGEAWSAYDSQIENVVVAEGATNVGPYAFYNFTNLKSVRLPPSVDSIERISFSGCTSLASIVLPANLVAIGDRAFLDCKNLTLTSLPDSVAIIDSQAFMGCTSLALAKLPADLVTIGRSAFDGCVGLTSLTAPASLASIGESAFAACGNLKDITFAGSTAASIGVNAFADSPDLTIHIPVGATGYGTGGWPVGKVAWPVVVGIAAGGTATADPAAAKAGQTVSLAAQPQAGFRLAGWTADPSNLVIQDDKFTMPTREVTVTPRFEDVSALTFAVTVEGSYGAATGAGSYVVGDTVTIDAGQREGYVFKGWTSADGVTFADAAQAATTFTMPDHAVTVTAQWEAAPTQGGDGQNPPQTPETPEPPEPETPEPETPEPEVDDPFLPGPETETGDGFADGDEASGDGSVGNGMPQTGDDSTVAVLFAFLALASAALAFAAHRKQPLSTKMSSRKH